MEPKIEKKVIDKEYSAELLNAYEKVANYKWGDGYSCRNCSNEKYINGKTPFSRRCSKCKKDESVTSNTIFDKTRLPLDLQLKIVSDVWHSNDERMKTTEYVKSEKHIYNYGGDIIRTIDSHLRQKTMWAVLNKVYAAVPATVKSFNGDVCIVSFSYMDKSIIAGTGIENGDVFQIEVYDDTMDSAIAYYISSFVKDPSLITATYIAERKMTMVSRTQKNVSLTIEPTHGYAESPKEITDKLLRLANKIFSQISGLEPGYFKNHINLLNFKLNKHSYEELLLALTRKSIIKNG